MPRSTIELPLFTCGRCDYQWWPKSDPAINPVRCPHCKSPLWDTMRTRPRRQTQLPGPRLQIPPAK